MMETLLGLASFAFVTSATPGPNNILLTASGGRFGFRKTLPHIIGVQLGIAVQLALCATGIGVLLISMPGVSDTIKLLGTLYLLYLAVQLCSPAQQRATDIGSAKPFTILQAALFQFINPKAWVMTVTASSLFLPDFDSRWLSILTLCLTFSIVSCPSSGSWALIGHGVQRYLENPLYRRLFSSAMAALTLYSAASLWFF